MSDSKRNKTTFLWLFCVLTCSILLLCVVCYFLNKTSLPEFSVEKMENGDLRISLPDIKQIQNCYVIVTYEDKKGKEFTAIEYENVTSEDLIIPREHFHYAKKVRVEVYGTKGKQAICLIYEFPYHDNPPEPPTDAANIDSSCTPLSPEKKD